MKKQLVLPAIIALFAVGSAFASIKMAPGYYGTNDSDCNGTISVTPQCTLGNDSDCTNENLEPYYTKPDSDAETSPENPCTVLRKQGF